MKTKQNEYFKKSKHKKKFWDFSVIFWDFSVISSSPGLTPNLEEGSLGYLVTNLVKNLVTNLGTN